MASRAQLSDELFLQFKSAMVGGDPDALERFRQSTSVAHRCCAH
jgi:hypothetical protein